MEEDVCLGARKNDTKSNYVNRICGIILLSNGQYNTLLTHQSFVAGEGKDEK